MRSAWAAAMLAVTAFASGCASCEDVHCNVPKGPEFGAGTRRFLADVASLPEAVRMASTTPARTIGRGKHKGRLAPGYDADIVALSSDFTVLRVWVGGRPASFP